MLSDQTHTDHIHVVTKEDAGNGLIKPLPYHDIDGLITNVPGMALSTFYADCVPVFLIDIDMPEVNGFEGRHMAALSRILLQPAKYSALPCPRGHHGRKYNPHVEKNANFSTAFPRKCNWKS